MNIYGNKNFNETISSTPDQQAIQLIKIDAYTKALNASYGLKTENFKYDYLQKLGIISEFSKEINSQYQGLRFMFKEMNKPGWYQKWLKKANLK